MGDLQLIELDTLEILVIIDNELDPISASPNPAVAQTGGMRTIAFNGPNLAPDSRGGAVKELRMDHICCSAHGLSLLVTAIKDSSVGRSTGSNWTSLLFDTGPEESAFEKNATRLNADLGSVSAVHLSHWHRDHSGGILKALEMMFYQQSHVWGERVPIPVHVDLHPARPDYRGLQPPGMPVVSLEADPSFEEIEKAGGTVSKNDQPHTLFDGKFLVSGEIPRVTSYEHGLKMGVRYEHSKGAWESDESVTDERFVMCKLKDKGLVMFTGCSHAGVVNASKHAIELGGGAPLYAVMGGFHLADAEPEQIQATVADLKALGVKILLAGHCTGWRAKFEIQKEFPEGVLVPSFVGSQFVL